MCVCVCVCVCMRACTCTRGHTHTQVQLLVTTWTVTHQAPLSMGFSRQEYQSWLPLPTPGVFPTRGLKPFLLALAGRFFTTVLSGNLHLLCIDVAVQSINRVQLCDFKSRNQISTLVNRLFSSGRTNPNLIEVNNMECISSHDKKTEQRMILKLIYSVALWSVYGSEFLLPFHAVVLDKLIRWLQQLQTIHSVHCCSETKRDSFFLNIFVRKMKALSKRIGVGVTKQFIFQTEAVLWVKMEHNCLGLMMFRHLHRGGTGVLLPQTMGGRMSVQRLGWLLGKQIIVSVAAISRWLSMHLSLPSSLVDLWFAFTWKKPVVPDTSCCCLSFLLLSLCLELLPLIHYSLAPTYLMSLHQDKSTQISFLNLCPLPASG